MTSREYLEAQNRLFPRQPSMINLDAPLLNVIISGKQADSGVSRGLRYLLSVCRTRGITFAFPSVSLEHALDHWRSLLRLEDSSKNDLPLRGKKRHLFLQGNHEADAEASLLCSLKQKDHQCVMPLNTADVDRVLFRTRVLMSRDEQPQRSFAKLLQGACKAARLYPVNSASLWTAFSEISADIRENLTAFSCPRMQLSSLPKNLTDMSLQPFQFILSRRRKSCRKPGSETQILKVRKPSSPVSQRARWALQETVESYSAVSKTHTARERWCQTQASMLKMSKIVTKEWQACNNAGGSFNGNDSFGFERPGRNADEFMFSYIYPRSYDVCRGKNPGWRSCGETKESTTAYKDIVRSDANAPTTGEDLKQTRDEEGKSNSCGELSCHNYVEGLLDFEIDDTFEQAANMCPSSSLEAYISRSSSAQNARNTQMDSRHEKACLKMGPRVSTTPRRQRSAVRGSEKAHKQPLAGEPRIDPIQGDRCGPKVKKCPDSAVPPVSIITSKFALEDARDCLKYRRSIIAHPPPMSALPISAILVNSYLRNTGEDHRALILGLGLMSPSLRNVYAYFNSTFGGSHLVDFNSADDISQRHRNAPIVVAGNAMEAAAGSIQYSLVIALLWFDEPSRHVDEFQEALKKLSREEKHGICTSPSCVTISLFPECRFSNDCSTAFSVLSSVFSLKTVIVRNPDATRDFSGALKMARPSHKYVVLPPFAEEAWKAIQEAASSALYKFEAMHHKAKSPSAKKLSIFNLDREEAHKALTVAKISAPASGHEYLESMVLLNILKISYVLCLNESLGRTLEFLHVAVSKHEHDTLRKCIQQLTHIEKECSENGLDGTAAFHHRVDYVCRLLSIEKERFEEENSRETIFRIEKEWNVLVIADSDKTSRVLLNSIQGAADVESLSRRNPAAGDSKPQVHIAAVSQLQTSAQNHASALAFFSRFSLVVYLPENASGFAGISSLIPIEQLSHASALRFVQVSVDVTRKEETAMEEAENKFMEFCTGLYLSAEQAERPNTLSSCHSIHDAMRALMSCFWRQDDFGVSSVDESVPLQAFSGLSMLSMTNFLRDKLKALGSDTGSGTTDPPYLNLCVRVPRRAPVDETFGALAEALASCQKPLDRIRVVCEFELPQETAFAPSKRPRSIGNDRAKDFAPILSSTGL